jgi:3-hexulose-6-phosphate synthase/6-phospho-3-hexuloisomerase
MDPVLQVALDMVNGHRALKMAQECINGGADWLEIGTPLIKSEGLAIIKKIKKLFTVPLVADMKIMDTGKLETEIASKSGADVICIMGLASDSTLQESVQAAHRYGSKIMVDLMEIKNMLKRAKEVEKFGVDYLCIHVSIDEQMKGKKPLEDITRISEACDIPLAVAGGLNSETAPLAIKKGASIIIVGGAITKAENPQKATMTIKKAISTGKSKKTNLFKKYGEFELVQAFKKVTTCNLCDAMHTKGAMRNIKPLKKGYHLVGRALTVRTIDGDWAKPVEAVDTAGKEHVIVIEAGRGQKAIWGELATWSCIKKGVAGAVIDGGVRDVQEIRKTMFPVFTKNIAPDAGEPKGLGEIGGDIICGGQNVQQGDWIIGDDTGVVVVPARKAQEIANRAVHINEWENRIREEIKQGGSLNQVLDVKKWEKVT